MWVQSLEEEMATHSSVVAWRIPWTEEPRRLQSRGSHSRTQLNAHVCAHTREHTRTPAGL